MSSLGIVLPLLVLFCWGAEAGPAMGEATLGQEGLKLQQDLMNELNSLDPTVKKQLEALFSQVNPNQIASMAMNLVSQLQNLPEQQQQQVKESMQQVIEQLLQQQQ